MSLRHSLELHKEAEERQTLSSQPSHRLSGMHAYTAQEETRKSPRQQCSPFSKAGNKLTAHEVKGYIH